MDKANDDLEATVQKILSIGGLHGCILKKDKNSDNGLNFMASIIELGVIKNGTLIENTVVKRGFTNKALCEAFGGRICYETEELMYAKVIPALHRFQKAKGTDLYPHVARYFGACLESTPEILVLENLKKTGFMVHSPKTTFGEKHIEKVYKELAGYHAANFAMREQDPDGWSSLIGGLLRQVNYFNRNNRLRDLSVSRLRKLEMALVRENKREIAIHLNNFIKNINTHIAKGVEVNGYSIICHGDLWGCNVMFKYGNEQNPEVPTDVRLLDWQASCLGHLCLDLTYFTYMSASPEILNNIGHYMKLYYNNFSSYLGKLGIDPATVFPYTAFQEQWQVCSAYAFIIASGVFCGIYIEPDEFPDLVAVAESGECIYKSVDFYFRNTDKYNEKLTHVFEHLVQNNFVTV